MKKNIISEVIKCLIYAVLGIFIGITLGSTISIGIKILIILCIVFIEALMVGILNMLFDKKQYVSKQITFTSMDNNVARVNSRAQINVNSQVNALDRKPMSVEKREQYDRNKMPAKKIVLLNEEGTTLISWSLENKTSLVIGKSKDNEKVDIDLSGSAVAQMISKQHAVLNYTEKGWYIDDIDSKNGTRVKKAKQNSIMDVKLVGAIEVETGDIIYIANAMLQIQ